MRKMKSISLLLVVTLLLSMTAYATDSDADDVASESEETFAEDADVQIEALSEEQLTTMKSIVQNSATEKTEEEVEEYAVNFMRGSQQDYDIQISTTEPLYDLEDNLTGYYITFAKNGDSKGYIIISFLHSGTPVVDMSFDGTYEKNDGINAQEANGKSLYLGEDIYVENPDAEGEYISILNEESITENELNEQLEYNLAELQSEIGDAEISAQTIYDGIIFWEDTSLDGNTIYKIPHFGAGSDYWIMTDFTGLGSNNCGPTAATNILWFWGWHFDTNLNNVSHRVAHMSTNWSKANLLHDTVGIGMRTNANGTNFDNIPAGFVHLFQTQAGQGDWNYKTMTSFGSAYDTILEECPILMYIRYGNTGHFIFAMGRANSVQGTRYVMVMDGWNRRGRLVRDNYYNTVRSYKIWVRV